MDVASGVVHMLTGTAANAADINQTAALLHGREEAVFADAGYTGADKRPELEDRDVSWNIAVKRSIVKALPKGLRDWAEPVERALSQLRAPVEHPFHVVKNRFGHGTRFLDVSGSGQLFQDLKSAIIRAEPLFLFSKTSSAMRSDTDSRDIRRASRSALDAPGA